MPDPWDPLLITSADHVHWTTTNIGEALPGVLSPLSWTTWADTSDYAPREAAYRLGVLTRTQRVQPPPGDERITGVFYGRAALRVDYMALLGDRLPGTTGPEAVTSVLGRVPEGLSFAPTRRRYPLIAARMPWCFATTPRRVRTVAAECERWWRDTIAGVGAQSRGEAVALLAATRAPFSEAVMIQTLALFAVIQPLYDAVARLVEATGVGDTAALSGSGGAEIAVVSDMWNASRRRIDIAQVVANHGFHGPREGELSSVVWREDDAPLRRVIEQYSSRDDGEDPMRLEAEHELRRDATRRALLAALPARRRPGAALLLSLARERILLRGVAKRAFLQVNDLARAAARRIGEHLAADGVLADRDDVFFLTIDELLGTIPADAGELAERRRDRHAEYEELEIPAEWTGVPTPLARTAPAAPARAGDRITGIGVSPGIAEGVVRVVTDPGFADVEPDEILVARTTDPSWSSIMFISSALVMDIGGALSHAAVVARELGIPCVVNTGVGTTALRTGDRVRVDGAAGTVEVLAGAGRGAR